MDAGALGSLWSNGNIMLILEVVTRLDKFVKIHRTNILPKGEFYCMSINPILYIKYLNKPGERKGSVPRGVGRTRGGRWGAGQVSTRPSALHVAFAKCAPCRHSDQQVCGILCSVSRPLTAGSRITEPSGGL